MLHGEQRDEGAQHTSQWASRRCGIRRRLQSKAQRQSIRSGSCAYPSPDVRDPEDPAIPAWMFGSLCRSALIATNELPFKMCFLLALRGCLDGWWAKSRTGEHVMQHRHKDWRGVPR